MAIITVVDSAAEDDLYRNKDKDGIELVIPAKNEEDVYVALLSECAVEPIVVRIESNVIVKSVGAKVVIGGAGDCETGEIVVCVIVEVVADSEIVVSDVVVVNKVDVVVVEENDSIYVKLATQHCVATPEDAGKIQQPIEMAGGMKITPSQGG